MLAKERRDKIYMLIMKNGAVTTAGLMEKFNVSIETVRRDLLEMEKQGQLTRVHGGAVARGSMKPFLTLERRNEQFGELKYELSKKAMEFISEGDIISIDAGSTANVFAEVLKEHFSQLTVVTHSLDVVEILRDYGGFSIILCGGTLKSSENTFYGALTLETLSKLHVQKSFVFPSAVSLSGGICDYQEEFYPIQRKLIECADEVFILADSSKLEKSALLKISDMNPDYTYITDSGIAREIESLYKENNIKIFIGGRKS